jgi:hypothetical protein
MKKRDREGVRKEFKESRDERRKSDPNHQASDALLRRTSSAAPLVDFQRPESLMHSRCFKKGEEKER